MSKSNAPASNSPKAPERACVLIAASLAAVPLDEKDKDKAFQPVILKARANDIFIHDYWGGLLHDFSTMSMRERICIDLMHGDELIGYIDSRTFDDTGALMLHGYLTGSTQSSRDTIQQLRDGIPLQASIDWSGRPFDVNEVKPGNTILVNNTTFTAPEEGLSVIQNWELCAVAICKIGYDPRTKVHPSELSGDGRQITYTIHQENTNMSAAANKGGDKPAATKDPKTATENNSQGNPPAPSEQPDPAPQNQTQQTLSAGMITPEKLTQYREAFGTDSAMEYLSAGLTFEQAQAKDYLKLKAENEAIGRENASLKNKISVLNKSGVDIDFTESDGGDNGDASLQVNGATVTRNDLLSGKCSGLSFAQQMQLARKIDRQNRK